MKDPTRQMLRLRSMYAERESDSLLFQQKDQSQGGGLELVETPLAVQHMDKVCYCTCLCMYVGGCFLRCLPA